MWYWRVLKERVDDEKLERLNGMGGRGGGRGGISILYFGKRPPNHRL